MIIQELLLICRGSINENQRRKAMFRKQKKRKKLFYVTNIYGS